MSLTHKAHHPSVCMSLSIHIYIYDSLRKLNLFVCYMHLGM